MPSRYTPPRPPAGRTSMPLTTAQQQAIINQRQTPARPGSRVPPARPMVNSDRTIVWPTTASRANYNAMAEMFGPNCVLFPGTLRAEVTLVATQQISFAITEGAAPAASITEVRLPQNDAFIVEQMMIALSVQLTADGVSTQVVHTFPNDKVFTTAASLNAAKTFYNGRVTIQLNDVMYARGLDMMNFQRADSAQAGQAISSVATTGVQSTSAWEGNRAFKALVPNIILNGTSTNSIVVQLPETATFTLATFTIRAVLMVRGIWAQNAGRMRSQ